MPSSTAGPGTSRSASRCWTGTGRPRRSGRRRGHRTTCRPAITGMGLHIMRYRANMIGGSLDVRASDAAARWSTVFFQWAARVKDMRPAHAVSATRRPGGKRRVLVVDDHPIVRQGLDAAHQPRARLDGVRRGRGDALGDAGDRSAPAGHRPPRHLARRPRRARAARSRCAARID